MFSCHLLLISSASVKFIPFLSFIVPIFAWNVPLLFLIFLKRSSFPLYCFSLFLHIDHLSLLFFGTLHSDGYSFPFLLCLFCLFSQVFVRPPQTTTLCFCISFFSWGWFWSLPPIQWGFPCGWAGKESAFYAGDVDLIPGLGRSPKKGKGYPLQYSGLVNFMDCIMGSQRVRPD